MVEPLDPPLLAVPKESRRDHVVRIIRDAIVTGQLSPGQRLNEQQLSQQLRTSRSPIREALRSLEQEGLVVSYPYKGTEVLGISQDEIEEVLLPIRVRLETFAFTRAQRHMTQDDYTSLNVILERMAAAAAREDALGVADSDLAFHEMVIEFSQQPHCLQIWRSIQSRVRTYFWHDLERYADTSAVVEQHRALFEALRNATESDLEAAVASHIRAQPARG